MILTVLVLGGIIISAATLISYLIVNNLKQATDIGSSARAVFASDAGREWELWKALKLGELPNDPTHGCPKFTNGASFTAGIGILSPDSTSTLQIISAGVVGKNTRAWIWINGMNANTPTSSYPLASDNQYIKTTCQ